MSRGCYSAVMSPKMPQCCEHAPGKFTRLAGSSALENVHGELNALIRSGCGPAYIRCLIEYRMFTWSLRVQEKGLGNLPKHLHFDIALFNRLIWLTLKCGAAGRALGTLMRAS